jgi:aminopeptidase N
MKQLFYTFILGTFLFSMASCESKNTENVTDKTQQSMDTIVYDVHSNANINEVKTTHLNLNLTVNFDKRIISGVAQHTISAHTVDKMIFDTRGLKIEKVTLDQDEKSTTYSLGKADPVLGAALTVKITPSTKSVNIYYKTTAESDALDWLSPNLTAGKVYPFMYTQGEAILTRTWIPIQDSPSNRITYSADIQVPDHLMAVMSAVNPTERNENGKYHFDMKQSIPCYLIALAVGDLDFQQLGGITGVYAEPSTMKSAAWELADIDKMVHAAEKLYGKYQWGRYDVLILPPAFPFGGMENPRITFATPTILAGDRSLVSLIAHEMAHSWSGNLVTNATWDDFWLNEGFTVYFESRIMEEVAGKDVSDMLSLIEFQELENENKAISESTHPKDTHLKLDLSGRNPDDGMTSIAYIKGSFFLRTLESIVGREKFDAFLKGYFNQHQFQTITTEEFVTYLKKNLLEPNHLDFNINEWIYGPGIPKNCVKIISPRFDRVNELAKEFTNGKKASDLGITRSSWITQEWMNFIRQLPDTIGIDRLKELDKQFDLKGWGNAEIMSEWFVKSIHAGYKDIRPEMKKFLFIIGRRKFLQPIYTALAETPDDKKWAIDVYKLARQNYHAISYNTIDLILDYKLSDK